MHATESTAPSPSPSPRTHLRALVVDDSLPLRHMLVKTLKSAGVLTVVGTAVNGSDALTQVAELTPDIVFMDIEMPVMNGIEATRRIKQLERAPRVIIVSCAPPSLIRTAMHAGADGFCDKTLLAESLHDQLQPLFPNLTGWRDLRPPCRN